MDDSLQTVSAAAWCIAPELGLIAAATILVLLGSFLPAATADHRRTARMISITIAVLALVIPLAVILFASDSPADAGAANAPAAVAESAAPFVRDGLACVIQPAAYLAGLFLLILVAERLNERFPAEHLSCLLFIVAGMSLVASANDLIALFVALELISIPTYVLLYLSRPQRGALEAAVKYFLLSIFSSALLLYGLSFLLGSAGSTNFTLIESSLRQPTGLVTLGMLQIALILVVAGLGFRVAAVPFHFYAPDVFQGSSLPSAALLAVVPKIAGFVALLRLVWSMLLVPQVRGASFAGLDTYGITIVALLAFVTMTVGNVLALLQTDLRRLLAYSSVAHAGYMLVGLAVQSTSMLSGAQAVVFYLLIYSIMTLGAFGVLVMIHKPDRPVESIRDLSGLGATNPGAALLLAVFMFGLTGLPPTAGFTGKFNLFLAAWGAGTQTMRFLAVGLAVNAAIAAWYYLRLVKTAYLDTPTYDATTTAKPSSPAIFTATALCALGAIGLFLVPGPLWALLTELK